MAETGNCLLFATGNSNKTIEIRNLLKGKFEITDLCEMGFAGDLKEEEATLEGNALSKARQALELIGVDACFAEDTGLEVDALNGAPGVFSARFAGPGRDSKANIKKLLLMLDGESNRNARFRTVIAYVNKKLEQTFVGSVEGTIAFEPSGNSGFGYDPVFIPQGYSDSFGELPSQVKDTISHRAEAFRKFAAFLNPLTLV